STCALGLLLGSDCLCGSAERRAKRISPAVAVLREAQRAGGLPRCLPRSDLCDRREREAQADFAFLLPAQSLCRRSVPVRGVLGRTLRALLPGFESRSL